MTQKDATKRSSVSKKRNSVSSTQQTPGSVDGQDSQEDSAARLQIQTFLNASSGQHKVKNCVELEHDYAKPYNVHPDPFMQVLPTKYLFMKDFPRHYEDGPTQDEMIDVTSYEEHKKIPFLGHKPGTHYKPIVVNEEEETLKPYMNDLKLELNILLTRIQKLLNTERIVRLTIENDPNYVLLRRNQQEETVEGLRSIFASTGWNIEDIQKVHNILLEELQEDFKTIYIEALDLLKAKIPNLVSKFYVSETKAPQDPMTSLLNHYKLKKLPKKPVFIIVPHEIESRASKTFRFKSWMSTLGSIGRVVNINASGNNDEIVANILSKIIQEVGEKVQFFRQQNENQPIILVGFHYGSVVAATCALYNQKSVTGCLFFGFPLQTSTKMRGGLDDPLLDLTIPCQFIVGENSLLTTIDNIENFRESMTRAKTSLVMVGGANDHLVVSCIKKRFDNINQAIVDRCIAEEMFNFLESILTQPVVQIIKHTEYASKNDFNLYQPKKKYIRKRKSQAQHPPVDPNASVPDLQMIGPMLEGQTIPGVVNPPTKKKKKSKKEREREKARLLEAAAATVSMNGEATTFSGIPSMPSLFSPQTAFIELKVDTPQDASQIQGPSSMNLNITVSSKIDDSTIETPVNTPAQPETTTSTDQLVSQTLEMTAISPIVAFKREETTAAVPLTVSPNSQAMSLSMSPTSDSEIHTRHGRTVKPTKCADMEY